MALCGVPARPQAPRGARAAPARRPPARRRAAPRAAAGEENANVERVGSSRIHTRIQDQGCVMIPGVYDALSARLAQDAGFSAAFVSGYALSAVTLGAPDVGLLTQPEVAAATRNITQAVQGGMNVGAEGMPIIADADTGGGNALNVRRTVLDLIAAGASGCIIEDQMWPKRCGHSKRSHPIISQDEMLSKVRAARDAAEEAGADFFVIARTDARATSSKTGLDLAIERANAYMSAGADASYIEAPRSVEELERIGKETVGPRVANMISGTFTPDLSLQELQDMGYQIVLRPLTGLLAAQKALTNAYGALMSDGSMAQREHVLSTPDELRETLRLTNVYDIEDRYYTEDRLPKTMELNTRVGKSYPYPKAS